MRSPPAFLTLSTCSISCLPWASDGPVSWVPACPRPCRVSLERAHHHSPGATHQETAGTDLGFLLCALEVPSDEIIGSGQSASRPFPDRSRGPAACSCACPYGNCNLDELALSLATLCFCGWNTALMLASNSKDLNPQKVLSGRWQNGKDLRLLAQRIRGCGDICLETGLRGAEAH